MNSNGPELTAIQSRILIFLFRSPQDEFMDNRRVLSGAAIAQSTWSQEQKRLIRKQLIEKRSFRSIRGDSVCKTVRFRLTSRGRAVALILSQISKIMIAPFQDSTTKSVESEFQSAEELERGIMEAIEVALDSFGINLIPLVKNKLEIEYLTPWNEILRYPDRLLAVLKDLFGTDGGTTIESMILDNLRFRFESLNLMNRRSDLPMLIAELLHTRITGQYLHRTISFS